MTFDVRDLLRDNGARAVVQGVLAIGTGVVEAWILALFATAAAGSVLDLKQDAGFLSGYFSSSRQMLLAALGGVVVRFALSALSAFLTTGISQSIILRLRQQVVTAYSSAGWIGQIGLSDGTLQQLVVDLPSKASASVLSLLKSFANLLTLVAMIAVAAFSDLRLTAILLIGVVSVSGVFIPLRAAIRRSSRKVLSRQRELASQVFDLSRAKLELNALRVKVEATKPVFHLMKREAGLSRWVQFLKGMVEPIYVALTYSGIAIGLLVIAPVGGDTLGSTGGIFLIVLRSLSYGQSLQTIGVTLAAFRPISETLHSEISRLDAFSETWGEVSLERLSEIKLQRVDLSYGRGVAPVLSDVSVRFSPGERVGIVGPSGSGKTSLCRALLGLLPVESDALRVGGFQFDQLSQSTLRDFVGFVPQEPTILRGSLRENLIFFRDAREDEVLWGALRASNLAEDVGQLPNGLDTMLGPGDHEFSGGQRQRLAIARALVADPKFLVMDEPTSSVDYHSERAIIESIRNLPPETCLVIVTHRPEIISDCTRLIVVEQGRITADGERSEVCRVNDFAHALLEG